MGHHDQIANMGPNSTRFLCISFYQHGNTIPVEHFTMAAITGCSVTSLCNAFEKGHLSMKYSGARSSNQLQ